MTAHPKQKVTRSNQGKRRAHDALTPIGLVDCSKCGEKKRPHRVCQNCGTYNGKQIIEFKESK